MLKMLALLGLVIGLVAPCLQAAGIQVEDDLGHTVLLPAPAVRIISLSPHLTEMMFTLEVGDHLVGTGRYSNYPEAAIDIPRVGDAFAVNIEAIVALQPDLILAWHTGGVNKGVNRLRKLGYPIYVNESPTLASIGVTLEKLGRLTGSPKADTIADAYAVQLAQLQQSYDVSPRVFFQISDIDLYSVSDQHLIGQAITHCGGRNVFSDLPVNVTQVSQEAVIRENPDVLMYTQVPGNPENPWVERWRSFAALTGRLVPIDPNLISRPSFRMLAGIREVCAAIATSP
jgi:iron complex transport system substrate-binding protein